MLHQGSTIHRIFLADGRRGHGIIIQAHTKSKVITKIRGKDFMANNNDNGVICPRFLHALKDVVSSGVLDEPDA